MTDRVTTQVANLCLFSCSECPFNTDVWGMMRKHLRGKCVGDAAYQPRYVRVARLVRRNQRNLHKIFTFTHLWSSFVSEIV